MVVIHTYDVLMCSDEWVGILICDRSTISQPPYSSSSRVFSVNSRITFDIEKKGERTAISFQLSTS